MLGVQVDMIDELEALARVEHLHDRPLPAYVSYLNPHTANLALSDQAFSRALTAADLRLPDGFGLRFAARRQGIKISAILNGSDFNLAVLVRAAERGWPVFLLGGREDIAQTAVHV